MSAALITGGARRIGATITRAIAASGRPVVIHYRSGADEAETLAREIIADGGAAYPLHADLADQAVIPTILDAATALAGPITILINNASHFAFDQPASITAASIQAHITPNLTAPILLARDLAARIGASDGDHGGVIINILDQKLANLNPDFFSYTIAKAGLAAATEMLAMALAPRIRVCAISPGLTLIGARQSPENFEAGQRATPLRHGASPADIARAVMFIIDTPSLTGIDLLIDGGEHLMRRQRDVSFSA